MIPKISAPKMKYFGFYGYSKFGVFSQSAISMPKKGTYISDSGRTSNFNKICKNQYFDLKFGPGKLLGSRNSLKALKTSKNKEKLVIFRFQNFWKKFFFKNIEYFQTNLIIRWNPKLRSKLCFSDSLWSY